MNGLLSRDVDSPLMETRIPKEKGWRPSRRQIRVATVLGLVLTVVLTGWARAVGTPPKLRFTNIAVFPVDPKDGKAIRNVDSRLGREVEIDFVSGGRFTVLLDLANEGRRPVKIKALPDDYDLGQARRSGFAPDSYDRRPELVDDPVEPFTLAPGASVTVAYTFTFPARPGSESGCMLSPDQINSIPVTYRKFGFRRVRSMPFERAHLSTFTAPRCDENLNPRPSS